MQNIIYEPHPVSAERKAELKRSGALIIDAKYKPKDYVASSPVVDDAVDVKIDLGTDSGDQFSDAQLRDIIGAVTGTTPSGAAKRENLIKRFNDINENQPDETAEAIKLATEQGE